ncbi:hypothetical protein WN944_006203 [Citrus x changshan-huyou]|uniref:Uncharacterized protein n=1 Tax=Citrus x changshan-huyou TaxID=2935761 RepID=A0AAP0QTA8_9ROSI
MLDFSNEEVHLTASAKAFLKMTNLRLLKILNFQLPAGLESLSDELRLLQWHGYPLKSLPKWKKLWNVTCAIGALNNFGRESKTPDFTGAPNLEELILDGCKRLREIHSSLLVNGKLILLKSRKLYKSYNSSKGDCY